MATYLVSSRGSLLFSKRQASRLIRLWLSVRVGVVSSRFFPQWYLNHIFVCDRCMHASRLNACASESQAFNISWVHFLKLPPRFPSCPPHPPPSQITVFGIFMRPKWNSPKLCTHNQRPLCFETLGKCHVGNDRLYAPCCCCTEADS